MYNSTGNTRYGIKRETIHKTRQHISVYFNTPPPFTYTFTIQSLCSKVVIYLTPSPSTDHVVYGCPRRLLTFLFWTVSSSLLVSRIRDSIESPFDPWLLYWFFCVDRARVSVSLRCRPTDRASERPPDGHFLSHASLNRT